MMGLRKLAIRLSDVTPTSFQIMTLYAANVMTIRVGMACGQRDTIGGTAHRHTGVGGRSLMPLRHMVASNHCPRETGGRQLVGVV
jgi:hypothetical protein